MPCLSKVPGKSKSKSSSGSYYGNIYGNDNISNVTATQQVQETQNISGWISAKTYAIKVNGKYYSFTPTGQTDGEKAEQIKKWAKSLGVDLNSSDIGG